MSRAYLTALPFTSVPSTGLAACIPGSAYGGGGKQVFARDGRLAAGGGMCAETACEVEISFASDGGRVRPRRVIGSARPATHGQAIARRR